MDGTGANAGDLYAVPKSSASVCLRRTQRCSTWNIYRIDASGDGSETFRVDLDRSYRESGLKCLTLVPRNEMMSVASSSLLSGPGCPSTCTARSTSDDIETLLSRTREVDRWIQIHHSDRRSTRPDRSMVRMPVTQRPHQQHQIRMSTTQRRHQKNHEKHQTRPISLESRIGPSHTNHMEAPFHPTLRRMNQHQKNRSFQNLSHLM